MCFFILLSNIHSILSLTLLALLIPSNFLFSLLLFTSFPSFLPSFLPSDYEPITVIHLHRWRWTRRFFTIEGKYLKWYQSVTSSTCNGCIDLRTGTSLHYSLIYLSDLFSVYRLKRSSIFSMKYSFSNSLPKEVFQFNTRCAVDLFVLFFFLFFFPISVSMFTYYLYVYACFFLPSLLSCFF